MSSADLARSVGDGSYFDQAKKWYRAEFVAPIAQRSWMMIIAAASIFCAICGMLALKGLLPLTERPAIPASQDNIDNYVIQGMRLRQGGESIDEAMLRFFFTEYVERRESYSVKRYEDYHNFVKAHSDEESFRQYDEIFGTANPRSLRNVLSDKGRRVIDITEQNITQSGTKAVANMRFTASFSAENMEIPKSQWKVTVEAYFRPLMVNEEIIGVIGSDVALDIRHPTFKVIRYELEQIK